MNDQEKAIRNFELAVLEFKLKSLDFFNKIFKLDKFCDFLQKFLK